MDLRETQDLIDLVSESNVSELEITEAEGKVRIVKSGGTVVQQYAAPGAHGPSARPAGRCTGCRAPAPPNPPAMS